MEKTNLRDVYSISSSSSPQGLGLRPVSVKDVKLMSMVTEMSKSWQVFAGIEPTIIRS